MSARKQILLKNRLILGTIKDSRPRSSTLSAASGTTYGHTGAALLLAFALFLAFPSFSMAGFLPAIPFIFERTKALELPGRVSNVQNMPLLQAALNSDPNPGKGGGDITIVGGTALLAENGPSGTMLDVEEKNANPDHISVYLVRSGDTLAEIAKAFDVSVNTIVWANNLKSRLLKEGQTLVILPVSGIQHSVVKGDTLQTLAKKYRADAEEIAQFNDLSSGAKLALGTTLIIPDGEVPALKATATTVTSKPRGLGGPVYEGYYLRPIIGGRRTQGAHGYNGVDLTSEYGAAVVAAAGGDVIVSRNYGWNGGYGNYIVIKHDNNTQTLYAHLSNNLVFEGARVVRGQVIGNIGNSGKSTGAHLHFEVRGAKNPF